MTKPPHDNTSTTHSSTDDSGAGNSAPRSQWQPAAAWQNRAGTVQARAKTEAAPHSPTGAAQALAQLAETQLAGVRPIGAGTALSPLAASSGAMLHTRHMRGIVSVDTAAGTVTVLAGTPLLELAQALEARGLMLKHLGGHASGTVGGALATGAHGAGLGMGRLAAGLTELQLIDAGGRQRRVGADDPHFGALALSLGALGLVTQATLQVQPLGALEISSRTLAWGEFAALAPEYAQAAPHVSLTWRPARGENEAVQLRQGRWVKAGSAASKPGHSLLDGAAHTLAGAGTGLGTLRTLLQRSEPTATLLPSQALLGHAEPLRELEYTVPMHALSSTLRDLHRALAGASAAGTGLQLPVQVRPLAADGLPLGADEDSATITLAAPLGLPPEISGPHFREAEAALRAHGGRPSWGKLHGLGEAELSTLLPQWAEFRAARDYFDPERRFGSPYLRRVLGE